MIPWLKYKYHQKKYFNSLKAKALDQQTRNASRMANVGDQDEVLKLAAQAGFSYYEYWDRVVLYLSGKESKTIKNCDMDQVELNYHRERFVDTVDNYAEV